MIVKLFTSDGQYLQDAEIPQEQQGPIILIMGFWPFERYFVAIPDTNNYREVPLSQQQKVKEMV